MKKKIIFLVILVQALFIIALASLFSVTDKMYFVFALAAILQFALLQKKLTRYFLWFTLLYAVIVILIFMQGQPFAAYLSVLLWFFWIALFNFLIYNMLQTDQYKKLYFGSFILWIIAFGAIYAGMQFINILVLKSELMPAKRDIAPFFMGRMKLGIIMGIALGLGYDIMQLGFRLFSNGHKDA